MNTRTWQAAEYGHRLDRTILIIAAVAFIPVFFFFQFLHPHLAASPLLTVARTLHIIVEYLDVIVSMCIFLLIWHAHLDRRNTFLLYLGHAFLIVGLLNLCHIMYYQQGYGLLEAPAEYDYFFTLGHVFQPLALSVAALALNETFSRRRRFYCLAGTTLLFILALKAEPYLSAHLAGKQGTADLVNWNTFAVALYVIAIFTYYKKKPFIGSKPNTLFLSALILLAYAEVAYSRLAFRPEGDLLQGFSPLAHLFEIAAYVIIYWVVFISSIRHPYKTLYQVKENLADKYRELGATLELLVQSEQRYRLLVENSDDLIYTLDPRSRITFVNQNVTAVTGYTPKELYDKSFFDLLTPESQKKAIAQKRNLLKDGRAPLEDLEILTKNGAKKPFLVNAQAIRDTEGQIIGFQGIARDISERQQEQEHMLHSEKLATVGLIASGIAHEIGTPLNIISGNTEFLLAELPEHHPIREDLEIIIDQCERISDQVRSLLDFARPSLLELASLDINETIHGSLHLLRHMVISRHKVRLNLAPYLPPLIGDKRNLQQLFINMFMNAFQAMPAGGTLKVSTAWISTSRNPSLYRPHIRIDIRDSGQGIERDKFKLIFEPFFTTKDMGEGTGLGLAVCLRIVKDHGGLIEVKSRVNKGTTFTVRLPLNR